MFDYHTPVLKEAVLKYLNAKEEAVIVDGTLGDGGHSLFILENTGPGVQVLGIDRDPNALERAQARLSQYADRMRFARGNYSEVQEILQSRSIDKVDALLLDLGVSSLQLEDPARGFSFQPEKDGPLDMRADPGDTVTAADLLVNLTDAELASVFKIYGEERRSKRIVRAIRNAQVISPIVTTRQLSNILSEVLPAKPSSKTHPATRVFQSLRLVVNRELDHLKAALKDSLEILNTGARILAISFHSLEDRIVKNFFRDEEKGCTCPPRVPVCVCGRKPTLKIITKKPVVPDAAEVARNPRSSSAKLRVAERIYV